MSLQFLAGFSFAGLVAVWGIYPLTIAGLAALRRRGPPAHGAPPRVSVVIATREEPAIILERVRDCLNTDYPAERLEVIVAHDRRARAPDLESLRPGAARLLTVESDAPGKAAGLNAGVRAAAGDVIVFADSHQRFDRHTIPNLVSALSRPGIGAATGSLRLTPGSGVIVSAYWAFEKWLRRAEARVHSTVGATGAVYAIRGSLWEPLPAGLILDDVYVPMRIVLGGLRVDFVEDAPAFETRTPTSAQEYGRKVRTLTGVFQLCAWLPATLVPLRNPIWLQFVFHKLLRLLTPYWVLILALWAAVSFHAAVGTAPFLALSSGLAALAVWAAFTRVSWAVRLRRAVVEAILLQVAVLVAGFNGLRGHWQVWDA